MKKEHQPYAYRRHPKICRFFGPGGREARLDQCRCPFHVDGLFEGRRIRRQSLRTRSRQIADRRVAELITRLEEERKPDEASVTPAPDILPAERTIFEAVKRFLGNKGAVGEDGKYRGDVEHGTYRKYATSLGFLLSFCEKQGITRLAAIDVDTLEDFRRTRGIGAVTWKVERQTLISFLAYCLKRKWIAINPAKELEPPRNLKPNEIVPYTLTEEARIITACGEIGGGKYNRSGAGYEQLRARAMVLLLRHTALHISDVATFPRDAVTWDDVRTTWRVRLRTQKSGEPVYLPIPEELKLILDAVPLPPGAAQGCAYYFWNAITSRRAVVGIAERTLSAVFKKSGVKKAHPHRFRHTLATRLLDRGATFEQIADILGNSPEVVRKHYGKWAKGRQDNIDRFMIEHFSTMPVTFPVTQQSHEDLEVVN
jgi:site-specific recombinase XerD